MKPQDAHDGDASTRLATLSTLHTDVNIFPNNYNDLMDLDAAMKIEDIVRKKNIPTWFFPTECAKAKVHGDNILRACPWDFNTVELIQIFDTTKDPDGQRLIRVREVAHGPVHVFYPDAAVMESSKRTAMDESSFILSSFNNQTTAPA
ncbi:hypothetical protein JX266_014244 [Neoarthrinium moseri]|nr:hypothetical protein JX266_014244 [Neoarthrinium moseri]